MVFSEPQSSELDATISETAMPAPSRLHSWRKGRSVTPAMGATIRLFLRETVSDLHGVCSGLGTAEKAPILYAVPTPTNCYRNRAMTFGDNPREASDRDLPVKLKKHANARRYPWPSPAGRSRRRRASRSRTRRPAPSRPGPRSPARCATAVGALDPVAAQLAGLAARHAVGRDAAMAGRGSRRSSAPGSGCAGRRRRRRASCPRPPLPARMREASTQHREAPLQHLGIGEPRVGHVGLHRVGRRRSPAPAPEPPQIVS